MRNKKIERRGGARPGAGRKPLGDARKTQITVSVLRDTLERIDRYAAEKSQSRSQAISELCDFLLQK